jgi:hypothetical protein
MTYRNIKQPSSKRNIETIMGYAPIRDKGILFIPYCTSPKHLGVISKIKCYYKKCEKRSKGKPCKYYARLPIEDYCILNMNGRNGCKY